MKAPTTHPLACGCARARAYCPARARACVRRVGESPDSSCRLPHPLPSPRHSACARARTQTGSINLWNHASVKAINQCMDGYMHACMRTYSSVPMCEYMRVRACVREACVRARARARAVSLRLGWAHSRAVYIAAPSLCVGVGAHSGVPGAGTQTPRARPPGRRWRSGVCRDARVRARRE